MSVAEVQRQLRELLIPGQKRGFFERLWGLRQDPAEVQNRALTELLEQLAPPAAGRAPLRGSVLRPYYEAACRELEQNLRVVREVGEGSGHPPFGYVTWLWRVSEVLESLERDGWLEKERPEAALESLPETLSSQRAWSATVGAPIPVGLGLSGLAFRPLLELAERETRTLARRRRLLEAARRVLLEVSAAQALPPATVQAHAVSLTQQIRELNLWQAAGMDPNAGLAHQLRVAVQGRDAARVTQILAALHELTPDTARAEHLRRRLARVRARTAARFKSFAQPPSLEELCQSTFGATAARAVRRAAAEARSQGEVATAEADLVRVGSAVDGAFELGRSLAPVRSLEEQRRMEVVPFPTSTLMLAQARRVSDLPTALIGDPRLLLHDLASHNLLSRRYLATRKVQRRASAPRYTEARYYLLDGSASMAGRRGRMRDALLISELGSMIRHLEEGVATARPVVYYRYFTTTAEPAVKASTVEEACSAIEAVLLRRSRGQTDVQAALLQCFSDLRAARLSDETLLRAQLVLVTDGVAEIDLQAVWSAREGIGDLPIRVSIIALGSENAALKELAAQQRARAEQVFYHYFSDQALHLLGRGQSLRSERVTWEASSPPPGPAAVLEPTPLETTRDADADAPNAEDDALWRELDGLVDELSVLQDLPDVDGIERNEQLRLAFDDVGISLSDRGFEAERAEHEAVRRDAKALETRFARWFPRAVEPAKQGTVPPPAELLEVIEIALTSVQELVAYLDGPPLQRRVDAIELLERLLVEAGVSPWDYCHALPFATERAKLAMSDVRATAALRDAPLSD